MSQNNPLKRLATGITGLDTVLCGGLVSGSVYIVQGAPGGGKTIFANNICFRHAAGGGKCVYFTLLSESHDRLIRHMRQLSFFDGGSIPDSVYYESAFDAMEKDGLDGVLKLLGVESQSRQAELLVVDGLFVLEECAGNESRFRRFINNLAALAHVSGATVLLLTNSKRTPASPEYTMVDGWIELGYNHEEYRIARFLQVHKIRGSDMVPGQHTMTITDRGITIYPRLESLQVNTWPERDRVRISSGIARLDKMLHGGFEAGASTLVAGPTGTGKTALGLQFIHECTREAPGLIFGFYENASDLFQKASGLGLDLREKANQGIVDIHWHQPVEGSLDELAYELLELVRSRGIKRLLVDGIEAFRQAGIYPERLDRFLTALTAQLRLEQVSTMFTLELPELTGGDSHIQFGPVSAIAENIILLRYVELESRVNCSIAIMKLRNSGFDRRVRRFKITKKGIRIGKSFGRSSDVLTGHAHAQDKIESES